MDCQEAHQTPFSDQEVARHQAVTNNAPQSDLTPSQAIVKELEEAEIACIDWLTRNLQPQQIQEFLPILGRQLKAMSHYSQDLVWASLSERIKFIKPL
ncbi:MAG: hypothetical protein PHQ58_04740 [Rhodoferax sp.]|uniref:hypothetical protein n=1 Tax=Rhodoferax sp. TaxID=50421 RepID=UPI002612054C|nr:hypothetical protein [Rhodoferax sp.]MDD2879720.1 hypothetical protein [Rhodoferax sp.]